MNTLVLKPTIGTYVSLTKPGIIAGNAITAVAGWALASRGNMNFWLLFAMLAGLSLIMASACVFNNCIDRSADGKMARTKNRAVVIGLISVPKALIFAAALGLLGIFILARYTHLVPLMVAMTGLFVYVVLYTLLKYRTRHVTLIGAIAGAVPPVVGYTAVTHTLDLGAWLLFAIVFFWQMPHFFAIAIYRMEEYASAMIPVLPIKKGILATKVQMVIYAAAFLAAAVMLTGYIGYVYLAVAAGLGLSWLWIAIQGFNAVDDKAWARKMFIYSLVVITVLCSVIVIL